MVSILHGLTERKTQSEKRPATIEALMATGCRRWSMKNGERPGLGLKRLALWNSVYRNTTGTTGITFPNASTAANSAFRALKHADIFRAPNHDNSDAATSLTKDVDRFGSTLNYGKTDSAKWPSTQQQQIPALNRCGTDSLSDVILRRNSCTARIHISSPLQALTQRRISQTEIHTINDSHVKRLLGAGGFGSVYMAVFDSRRVAVKKFHTKSSNEKAMSESFNAELIAKTLRHPNIVRIFGTSSLGSMSCVIMEYTGDMNLQQILNECEDALSLSRRLSYALDIVSALVFLHDNSIVHLDLKPTNILVTPYDSCKLGDFGCCQAIENDTGKISPTQRSCLTGTLSYRAPELLRGDVPTTSADIYSLGITLWQMSSGRLPYCGQNQHVVAFRVVAYKLRPETSSALCMSSACESVYCRVYTQCWDADPRSRPSADAVHVSLQELKRNCTSN